MIKPWLFAAVVAVVLIKMGFDNYSQYEKVRQQQLHINDNVETYKDTWSALQPTVKRWNDSFTPTSRVSDIVSLMNAIDIESIKLTPASELIMDGGRSDHGANIGLTRSCVLNNSRGYQFENASIADYLHALAKLESRQDVVFGQIMIDAQNAGQRSQPILTLSRLCALLREEDM